MNQRFETVRRLWSFWPDLPEEVINVYRSGWIDDDPSFADLALAVKEIDVESIDENLVVGCEKYVMYRIIGCFCYQCCRLLDGENIENVHWLEEVVDVVCSPGNDSELTEFILEFTTLEKINHGISDVFSLLNSEQISFFAYCMCEVLKVSNDAISRGEEPAENSPHSELLGLALKKLKALGLITS